MLIHDYETCTMLADTEFFLPVIATRNGKKNNKNYNETRLQNSPHFYVFKYARAVKQKVWNEAENRERDCGETLKIRFFFSRLARPTGV